LGEKTTTHPRAGGDGVKKKTTTRCNERSHHLLGVLALALASAKQDAPSWVPFFENWICRVAAGEGDF
jgi:hypothetical protein